MQTLRLFNDSKTFVDMPLRVDPQQVLAAFSDLARPLTRESVTDFVSEYFLEAGSDVLAHVPADWVSNPPAFARIQTDAGRAWALDLNEKWKVLGRITAPSVAAHPSRTSTLYRSRPFVVPGGRFRESYYWDTKWIVDGLIESGMLQTARDVVSNLLDDVGTFGFVPNGGRVYYTTRSQPPLLYEMVASVYLSTRNTSFLASALPILDKEYEFWMDSSNGRVVSIEGCEGSSHVLNRYFSDDSSPRPESYREDVETRDQGGQCAQVRAAAESGWDFSSRWMSNASLGLASLRTTDIVPVDLNCFLYRMEDTMAQLFAIVGNTDAANKYRTAASARESAISAVLWDSDAHAHADYLLGEKRLSQSNHAGRFLGLWAGLADGWTPDARDAYVAAFEASGLLFPTAVATTNVASGQQWDMPNAWSPLQEMIIEGLMRANTTRADAIAGTLARGWLQSNYKAWQPQKAMYEKYDARSCGVGGGGGEYGVQVGFGWTNGVVLRLLQMFPDTQLDNGCAGLDSYV